MEGVLSSESDEGRRRWSWRMWSKYWEGIIELPARVTLASLSSRGAKELKLPGSKRNSRIFTTLEHQRYQNIIFFTP